MEKCLSCKSTDISKAKNDAGFIKTEKHRPRRMYQYICNACGYVAMFGEKESKT